MSLSDEEIQRLVEERANERRTQNFSRADEIKSNLETFGVHLSDIPYRLGGGSTWVRKLDPLDDVSLIDLSKEVFRMNDPTSGRFQEIIQQAKEYLLEVEKRRELTFQWKLSGTNLLGRKYADIAFKFAMGGVCDVELFRLLSEGHMSEIKRFGHRKSCGVMDLVQMAEKLACAGINNQEIYQTTAVLIRKKITEAESEGINVNCTSIESLESGEYCVLSSHPLRMLWRFAAKQSKHGKQRKDGDIEVVGKDVEQNEIDSDEECDHESQDGPSSSHPFTSLPELESLFDECSRPLVLDLGCGFGTSLLGLCMSLRGELPSNPEEESPYKRPKLTPSSLLESTNPQLAAYLDSQGQVRAKGCNFLGCDMSKRAINYANSLSSRWRIRNKCQFIHCSVDDVLDLVSSSASSYSGPVIWININFPTPYSQRLLQYVAGMQSFVCSKRSMVLAISSPSRSLGALGTVPVSPLVSDPVPLLPTPLGNSQLPESLNDFMVSPNLFRKCALVFEKQTTRPFVGFVYLQSNAEDVALTMRTFIDSLLLERSEISPPYPELAPLSLTEDKILTSTRGRYRCVDSAESSISPALVSALWNSSIPEAAMDVTVTWATPETAITNSSKRQEIWSELFPVKGKREREEGKEEEGSISCRAVGKGWWGNSPLPKRAQTETEAVCDYQRKPIHRIVFAYSDS
jgi:SAM-dependent methyltransferase